MLISFRFCNCIQFEMIGKKANYEKMMQFSAAPLYNLLNC